MAIISFGEQRDTRRTQINSRMHEALNDEAAPRTAYESVCARRVRSSAGVDEIHARTLRHETGVRKTRHAAHDKHATPAG